MMFSRSPRIVSPSRTSSSVYLLVPPFSTVKSIGPAGADALTGSQPSSVSLKVSWVESADDDEVLSSLEPQAATNSATRPRAMAASNARTGTRFIFSWLLGESG